MMFGIVHVVGMYVYLAVTITCEAFLLLDPCLNPEACVVGAECQNLGDGQWSCTCAEDDEPSPECRGEKGK